MVQKGFVPKSVREALREPKNCLTCGNIFIKKCSTQIYCSEKCRYKAHNRRGYMKRTVQKATEPKVCLFCGNTFIPKLRGRKRIYCSKKCKIKALTRRRKAFIESLDFGKKKCLECGKIFTIKYANSTRKTCSPECKEKLVNRLQRAYSRKEEPRKCEICGVEFFSRSHNAVSCAKKECKREHHSRKARKKSEEKTRKEFSKGKVFVLDEEKWEWTEENRGD